MRSVRQLAISLLALAAVWTATGRPAHGQGPLPQRVMAANTSLELGTNNGTALAELRGWNTTVTAMTNAGQFRSMRRDTDSMVAGHRHERLAQFHRGVRVFGGEVVRETDFMGQVVSLFGSYYPNIDISVTPAIGATLAPAYIAAAGLGTVRPGTAPQLEVYPMDDGTYRLTWNARVVNGAETSGIFIDAMTGATVFVYHDVKTQLGLPGAVGSGFGVIGDPLKVQSEAVTGKFLAVDLNRGPGQDTTYNMLGSFARTNQILDGIISPAQSDIASDSDNKWTDPAVVSSQGYAGYTYDFYRQLFGRSGLDGNNIKIRCFVNPAQPQDAANPPPGSSPLYYENAAYFGDGYIVFGVGRTSGGQVVTRNWAGALDIVAHELTHGVTDFTSNLTCCNEQGALNEAFSDMMGVAVEFRFQDLGTGPGKADWTMGEDVSPTGAVVRNLSNPHSVLNGFPPVPDPDHYSLKQIGTADNGFVHANSNIVSHMYYLAIMGGVNRVSGQSVQGVGFANRQLVVAAVYRAFTLLMPSNSTFLSCRMATILAAQQLYGAGSPAEISLTQAWNAVGVQ